jgi:hypothetical protein
LVAQLGRLCRPVHVGIAPKVDPATGHQHRRYGANPASLALAFSNRLRNRKLSLPGTTATQAKKMRAL